MSTARAPRASLRRLAVALAVLATAAGAIYLINPPYRAFKIPSRVLGEDRTILEYLPAGYQTSGRRYPVLFHLDANPRRSAHAPSFYTVAQAVSDLGAPVPEMIVLGVTNTDRLRDMIPVPDTTFPPAPGRARAFLRFITEELIPAVEARYRTTDVRVLYGGSDAGLFALYALTEAPGAFEAVIASSPSLARCPAFMADAAIRLFEQHPALAKTLFLVYGGREGPPVARSVPDFAALIEQRRPAGFRLGVERVSGAGHVPAASLEDGLRFIFGTATSGGVRNRGTGPRMEGGS